MGTKEIEKPENLDPDALDIRKAIENIDKKGKTQDTGTKEESEKIELPGIDKFKNNEIAVTINKFLSKNIDPDAGDVYFGENVARTGEYYGMKSHPLIALGLSVLFLLVLVVKKVLRIKKTQEGG